MSINDPLPGFLASTRERPADDAPGRRAPDESPLTKRQGDIDERPSKWQWDIGQEEPEERPSRDKDD
jgi:hypothetical protein